MIAGQIMGNNAVSRSNDSAFNQQGLARAIIETKAAMRGLQLALRDIRLAQTSEQLGESTKYLEARTSNLHKYLDPAISQFTTPVNRERAAQLKDLSGQYYAGAKEIAALKAQTLSLAAAKSSDASERITALNEQAEKIARDRTLPIAAQSNEVIEKIVESALAHAEEDRQSAAGDMAWAGRVNMMIGIAVVLLLVGSAVFGSVSIARPLVALTKPINELAAGNFNVAVNGVGRKDEVGQIATAVNQMATRVRDTIGEIKQSAMEVNNASGEISTSTTDLSQ
ncbi:HAMP domain-containing protein, partial [Microbacteriaceae bacterium K1510]|nr:HAMP domain-containing protein [Microbacteriaceae bacterium K1510]